VKLKGFNEVAFVLEVGGEGLVSVDTGRIY
jgi:hypothetical protein